MLTVRHPQLCGSCQLVWKRKRVISSRRGHYLRKLGSVILALLNCGWRRYGLRTGPDLRTLHRVSWLKVTKVLIMFLTDIPTLYRVSVSALEVALHRARLVLGWVAILLYHLSTLPTTYSRTLHRVSWLKVTNILIMFLTDIQARYSG